LSLSKAGSDRMSSIDPSQTAAEVKKAEISTRQEMDQQISSTAVNKERALISQLLKQTLSRLTENGLLSVNIQKALLTAKQILPGEFTQLYIQNKVIQHKQGDQISSLLPKELTLGTIRQWTTGQLIQSVVYQQTQNNLASLLVNSSGQFDAKLLSQITIQNTIQQPLQITAEQQRQIQSVMDILNQIVSRLSTDKTKPTSIQTQTQSANNLLLTEKSKLEEQNKILTQLTQNHELAKNNWWQILTAGGFNKEEAFTKALLSTQQINNLKKSIRSFEDNLTRTQATLESFETQLKKQVKPEIEVLKTRSKAAQEKFNESEKNWSQAEKDKSRLQSAQIKLNRLDKEQQQVKKEFEVIGYLAKAASGKGNVKISLERFVLADLLDSVLSLASQRLHILSKGQYQLVRQKETLTKKAVAGLDLAINDAYTGKIRPVVTLSGGESFIASLALALALSDIVQQRSGGIQMDTLFVDEGFGSLDPESLQLAISTLVDLQSTGRTIGIISHVAELKEQMALRIDVTSSRSGSHVKTIHSLV